MDFFDHTGGQRVRDPKVRRKFFRQLCLCLQQIHQMGKIHRDIKRENFLIKLPEPCMICVSPSSTHEAAVPPPAAKKCPHMADDLQLKITDFGYILGVTHHFWPITSGPSLLTHHF